jgi:hypothetical protein
MAARSFANLTTIGLLDVSTQNLFSLGFPAARAADTIHVAAGAFASSFASLNATNALTITLAPTIVAPEARFAATFGALTTVPTLTLSNAWLSLANFPGTPRAFSQGRLVRPFRTYS